MKLVRRCMVVGVGLGVALRGLVMALRVVVSVVVL